MSKGFDKILEDFEKGLLSRINESTVVNENDSSLQLRTDNPGGRWLEQKRQECAKDGTNAYGAPERFGSVTGTFNRNVLLPVSILTNIRGVRGEQSNVRQDSLKGLTDHMGKTGRLPAGSSGKDYVPLITVAQDGTPWVNEGNHRIMAAAAIGAKYLPVEIRYFNGAENESGGLDPATVKSIDAGAHQDGLSLDNYFSYPDEEITKEDAPKGWSGTVKAMKKHKEIDNPFALAHYMKKKGDTPHYAEESAVYEDRFNAVMLKDILNGLEYVRELHAKAETVDDQEYADHHGDNMMYELNDLRDYLDDHPEYASHPMVERIYSLAIRLRILGPHDVPAMVGAVTESGELFLRRDEPIDFNDPEILIHGYGRLLRSQLHNKIGSYLADMAEKAKQGNLEAVKYMLDKSPLGSLVDAALDAEKELNTPQMKRKATLVSRKTK